MQSVLKVSTVVFLASAMFLVAMSAMAATFTNAEFDGQVNVEGQPGSTEKATLRVVVPVGQVVEYVQTDVISDGLSPVCHDIADLSEGTHMVDVNVKLPPNVNLYDLEVDGYGIFGNFTSNGCDEANNIGSASFNDVIRVVSGTSSSGSSGSTSTLEQRLNNLEALFASLLDKLDKLTSGVGSSKPACPPAYNGSNASAVQGWLMGNGYSSGFNEVGVYSPTGFFGPVTATAYAQANTACK